jgi:hypothetical protein
MGDRKTSSVWLSIHALGPTKSPRSCNCLMSLNEAWGKESWRGELRGGEEEVIK